MELFENLGIRDRMSVLLMFDPQALSKAPLLQVGEALVISDYGFTLHKGHTLV